MVEAGSLGVIGNGLDALRTAAKGNKKLQHFYSSIFFYGMRMLDKESIDTSIKHWVASNGGADFLKAVMTPDATESKRLFKMLTPVE